jgi:hypothetical protein
MWKNSSKLCGASHLAFGPLTSICPNLSIKKYHLTKDFLSSLSFFLIDNPSFHTENISS